MSEFNGLPEDGTENSKESGLEHFRKIRKETQAKWEALGFLDGFKRHVKQNIAELYECQASQLLPVSVRTVKKMNEDLDKKINQKISFFCF